MCPSNIVHKLWNYCNVLRDDGMSYGDYPSASLRAGAEQLTYLLFLKMADERSRPPYNQMARRTAKRGANSGNDFWGCTQYPACKGTRVI